MSATTRLIMSSCIACFPVVSSLHVHLQTPSTQTLGEQVGLNIREADSEIAAEVGQSGSASEFGRSFAEAFTAGDAVLVNPEVSKVLKKVNRLAENLIEHDGLCTRRWSAACPDGWSMGGNGQCVAPASYGGACKRVRSFTGLSIAAKQQIAEECKSPWPCDDSCPEGHNYDEACPAGWTQNGNGLCEVSAGSDTNCASVYNFANMDVKLKQELAETCNLKWKCQATCRQDFSKSCPENWTEVELNPGVCMAPPNYAGACGSSINAGKMTTDQKQEFGAKCAVTWPCSGISATSTTAR